MITRFPMVFLGCVIALILSSCSDNDHLIHAHDSLIGNWSVKAGFQRTAIVVNGMEKATIEQQEAGELGTFIFSENLMEYQYTFVTDHDGEQKYDFVTTKENAGFTQIDRYDILGELENFRVRYGNETENAHCDAVAIVLEQSISSDSLNVYLHLELVKDR